MLAQDEEADIFEYRQYLSAQSDDDLCDITRHLDPEHCPRRFEAARRELTRRHVLLAPAFSPGENALRYGALLAIVFCVLTLLLAVTMSPEEARQPQPPPSLGVDVAGLMLAPGDRNASADLDETNASVLFVCAWQIAQNDLREVVRTVSLSGGYLALFVVTTGLVFLQFRRRSKDASTASRDVVVLLLSALACQIMLLAVCGLCSVPILVNGGEDVNGGFLARAVTLLAPWG